MSAPESLAAEPAAVDSRTAPLSSGARSTAILSVASLASISANYVFLLAAGRILGSEDYGSLAALLGVLAVVVIPAGALQMVVSREVSRLLAAGDADGAAAFSRAVLRLSLLATVPLVVIALALALPLGSVLHIEQTGAVVLAESMLVTALVFPAATGVLQGSQRFHALAALYVVPMFLRLAVLAAVAVAGYRLGGAIFATVAAAIAGTALALALIRDQLAGRTGLARPDLRPFLRYLGPAAVGLVGIALLTHVDILIVKARFSGDEAGAYGAASAFARVGFFLPATILAVLFPRTAARQARGEETKDILGRSLLATAAFCGALALFYEAAGRGLVVTTYGSDFAQGGEILAPFALAIGLFSLANILVGYHLSRGETRYAWIVAAGIVVQIALLAVVPSSLEGVVWTNVAVGAGLIAAHEIAVGSSAAALRAGVRHLVSVRWAQIRAVALESLLVLLGLTAFVCALFWRVVVHLGSTIIGHPGSDSTGSIAWFWQIRHESGFHLFRSMHHTLSGAPFGWNDANALNIQSLLPYYPTYLASKVVGEVAAYNLVTLAGYVLSGASMYLLTRYLGCARLVCVWAALAYTIFPWHLAREEHASLLHVEVLVLLLLALIAAVKRPTWPRFALVAAAIFACWLTSGYFGAIAFVTTLAFAAGAALISNRQRALVLVVGAAAAALAVTAVLGIAAVGAGTNTGAGLNRAATDLTPYGLRPLELVVPPSGNIVLADRLDSFWTARDHGANATERANYLGLLTIALALAWLVLALRRPRRTDDRARLATAGLTAAFLVGLAFSAPSPVTLFGHNIWLPSRLLFEALPAFRVPSRWDPLLMATVVALAALGLQAIWRALAAGRGKRRALPMILVAAALVVSFLELSIKPASARFRTTPLPPEYAAIERLPEGVLAEYPLGYSDIYRLWQRDHGRPLLNGAPAETPADQARLVLLDPSQAGTARALSLLGVTAIGLHPGAHVDTEVLPREPAPGEGYRLVGRFPDGSSVWQVVAPQAPALATLPAGFAKPSRLADGTVGYAFVSSSGVGYLELRAKEARIVRLFFVARPPAGTTKVLRLADPASEQRFTLRGRTRISALVEVPRGVSRLLVKTDPPPGSEADAIVISAPRTEIAAGEPVLHAESISPDPGF